MIWDPIGEMVGRMLSTSSSIRFNQKAAVDAACGAAVERVPGASLLSEPARIFPGA